MAEYSRVATFEADAAGLEDLVNNIAAAGGAPPGVPGKRITVLADRAAGKVVVAIRFGSEEDLQVGSATLDAMTPGDVGSMRRVSVEAYEVVHEEDA